MRFSRALASVVVSFSLLSTGIAHTQEVSASKPIINQGDAIKLQEGPSTFTCTVGFVDRENRRIWTAGHCARDNSFVFTSTGTEIGVIKHPYDVDPTIDPRVSELERRKLTADYFFHDIAYIDLSDKVTPGSNKFSGDRYYQPSVGDDICRFGATTFDHVFCSKVLHIDDHLAYAADLGTKGGDSGGPAWVPGKGYVGQAVGAFNLVSASGAPAVMSIIHRADFNQQIPQRTKAEGFDHYFPSADNLLLQKATLKEVMGNHFGSDLPSAAEYNRILRDNELKLNRAKRDLDLAQERFNNAVNDRNQAQQKLNEAKADLEKLRQEFDGKNTQDLSQLQKKYDKLQKDSTIGIVVAIISAVIGLFAAVASWFAPHAGIRI
ncbi:hypothetical protein N7326_04990 [Corynebacterium sp. ES2794-CONJ1]|uniref:hypothetical protein n=1 Tax=unclassified Corynebacterium TaxID=2624378 RepID=UPI00216973C0|nr:MULTISPECIES: hypothetical protein [unclassified Corynebacterium]MCS4489909.1 hypothetical protein [Corynebacterium sp. ES2775-CONJ]MCS4491728.1 hypothetical protein [Corynebacterium sp. ES2715-CONJ3]MCS4531833.1 hypothetical protein [Corynebacterium sp. ES2730-CONJ]MCU9519229.1 hypothetical protein [Corynebacterium sp. ES2794-CONJ1]